MGKLLIELFLVTFKLGCTSFGGPTAHIGYFHKEYVEKQKWLSETEFTELVALCQALPGPASSQVGFGVGMLRAGILGGVISFLGFTLPSFLIMALFFHLIGFFSPV
jgi:chromate transporter